VLVYGSFFKQLILSSFVTHVMRTVFRALDI